MGGSVRTSPHYLSYARILHHLESKDHLMKLTPTGSVIALFVSKKGVSGRTAVASVNLDQKGIQTDKFYDKNIQRSVLLASIESYTLVEKEDISMDHGALGENILMDYNPYLLEPGSRLKIGPALLEITQYCTMCDHLTAIDPILPQLLCHDRGIFAKVISGGKIKKGDAVYLVEK